MSGGERVEFTMHSGAAVAATNDHSAEAMCNRGDQMHYEFNARRWLLREVRARNQQGAPAAALLRRRSRGWNVKMAVTKISRTQRRSIHRRLVLVIAR
jgi:hypothetical protein